MAVAELSREMEKKGEGKKEKKDKKIIFNYYYISPIFDQTRTVPKNYRK